MTVWWETFFDAESAHLWAEAPDTTRAQAEGLWSLLGLKDHRGCSPEPFQAVGPDLGGRLGLLARRPD